MATPTKEEIMKQPGWSDLSQEEQRQVFTHFGISQDAGAPEPAPVDLTAARQAQLQAPTTMRGASAPIAPESWRQTLSPNEWGKGALRGVAQTAYGAGELADIGLSQFGQTAPGALQQTRPMQWLQQQAQPRNTGQYFGKMLEQGAEFAMPLGEEKLAMQAPRLLRPIVRTGLGALKGGAVEELHGGQHPGAAMVAGGFGGALQSAIELVPKSVIGKLLGESGRGGGDLSQTFLDLATGKGGKFRASGLLSKTQGELASVEKSIAADAVKVSKTQLSPVWDKLYRAQVDATNAGDQEALKALGEIETTIGSKQIMNGREALALRKKLTSTIDWGAKNTDTYNTFKKDLVKDLDGILGKSMPKYAEQNATRQGLETLADAMKPKPPIRPGSFAPGRQISDIYKAVKDPTQIIPTAGQLAGTSLGGGVGHMPGGPAGAGLGAYAGGPLGRSMASEFAPGIIRAGRFAGTAAPYATKGVAGLGLELMRPGGKPRSTPFSME